MSNERWNSCTWSSAKRVRIDLAGLPSGDRWRLGRMLGFAMSMADPTVELDVLDEKVMPSLGGLIETIGASGEIWTGTLWVPFSFHRSARASEQSVFLFRQRGGRVCIFIDEMIKPVAVERSGLPGIALIARAGRALIEEYYREVSPSTTVVEDVGDVMLGRKHGKKYRPVTVQVSAGTEVVVALAPPPEYGGKPLQVEGLPGMTGLPRMVPAATCPGKQDFKETHDRVSVALASGWSVPPCPAWFYTVQDVLMDSGIKTCIHLSLDTAPVMVSAMRGAYERDRSALEDDGITRYGLLINRKAVGEKQQFLPERLKEAWRRITEHPEQRLMLLPSQSGGYVSQSPDPNQHQEDLPCCGKPRPSSTGG